MLLARTVQARSMTGRKGDNGTWGEQFQMAGTQNFCKGNSRRGGEIEKPHPTGHSTSQFAKVLYSMVLRGREEGDAHELSSPIHPWHWALGSYDVLCNSHQGPGK